MSELSPEAKKLIASTQGGDNPSAADEARVLKALAASVAAQGAVASSAAAAAANGTSVLATVSSSSLGVKVAAAIAVASIGVGGYVAVAPSTSLTASSRESANGPAPAPPRHSSAVADRARPNSPLAQVDRNAEEPTPPEQTRAVLEALPAAETPPLEAAPPAKLETPPPEAAPPADDPAHSLRRRRVIARRAPTTTTADLLAREVRLLGQVEAALRRGAAGEALAILNDYQHEIPRGQMQREADVLSVRAMCDLGRRADAQRIASRVRASHPDSPLVRRLEQTCIGTTR